MLVLLGAASITAVAMAFVGGQLVANGNFVYGVALLGLGSLFMGVLNAALFSVRKP